MIEVLQHLIHLSISVRILFLMFDILQRGCMNMPFPTLDKQVVLYHIQQQEAAFSGTIHESYHEQCQTLNSLNSAGVLVDNKIKMFFFASNGAKPYSCMNIFHYANQ